MSALFRFSDAKNTKCLHLSDMLPSHWCIISFFKIRHPFCISYYPLGTIMDSIMFKMSEKKAPEFSGTVLFIFSCFC